MVRKGQQQQGSEFGEQRRGASDVTHALTPTYASFGDDVTFEATSTCITNKVQQRVYVSIKAKPTNPVKAPAGNKRKSASVAIARCNRAASHSASPNKVAPA